MDPGQLLWLAQALREDFDCTLLPELRHINEAALAHFSQVAQADHFADLVDLFDWQLVPDYLLCALIEHGLDIEQL